MPVTYEEMRQDLLAVEARSIHALVSQAASKRALPGNTWFLDDGRVLCRDRAQGDSRYCYGRNGLHMWVHASGHISGNHGLFFALLPRREGQEPNVGFFIGHKQAEGTYEPLALLPTPLLGESDPPESDRFVVLGHDAAYFFTQSPRLRTVVRVFVDQPTDDRVDIAFSVLIDNTSDGALELFESAYLNPFCRHQFAETSEDPWFKQVRVAPADTSAGSLAPFVVSVNEDVDRFRSITHHAIVRRAADVGDLDSEVCTSRREYVGHTRASLAQARCLRTGSLGRQVALTVFNDHAVAADLHRFELEPGANARFDYVLSLVSTQHAIDEECRTPIHARFVDQAWRRVCADLEYAPHSLRMKVGGSSRLGIDAQALNRFFPFLKRQVEVCARTHGYMQPSPNSLIGFRDVFQAIEGHLYDNPDAARAKICEALAFVLPDGQCPRQYTLPANGHPGQSDLREFIDQGAWAISALHTYLAVTGDAALLDELLGYHARANRHSAHLAPADESDSVLEHLIRIMAFLNRHRDDHTGLVRALYGDWNDAVDGLGTSNDDGVDFGSGVSVMTSLQLYCNCQEMIEILERFYPGQYLDLVRQYRDTRSELERALLQHAVADHAGDRRIMHGWGDKRSYYVGSFQDSDDQPRDSLTSNAFWVLAGMLEHDPSLRAPILAAMRRLDSRYGLRTFWPGFSPDAPGVGRVVKLPIGTAENGASYVHATAFGIMALFELGEPQLAWRQIEKILPFAPHQTGLSHSSFVMPNCYVHNPELNLAGQNMNDWQTGSSNVLLKLLIRYVFGFRPQLHGLVVGPAAWRPFDQLDFSATAHRHRIRIRVHYGDVPNPVFRLNGQTFSVRTASEMCSSAAHIPYESLSSREINSIEVTQPAGYLNRG